jgi:hypothetical protein
MYPSNPSVSTKTEPHPIFWPCRLALAGGGELLVIRNLRPALEALLALDEASLSGTEPAVLFAAFLAAVSWPAALPHLAAGMPVASTKDEEANHDH